MYALLQRIGKGNINSFSLVSVIPEKSKCTQVGITFSCLLTLAPFVSSADTLAKAKRLTHFYSVAPLLEKRFACFPTSGDSFFVRVISLFFIFTYINLNSFFLSVRFPRTRREVPSLRGDRSKSAYTSQNHS